jgi:hypothetical protein
MRGLKSVLEKIIKIAAQRYFFVTITAFLFWDIHMRLASLTLDREDLTLNIVSDNVININEDTFVNVIKPLYTILSFLGLWFLIDIAFRNFFERRKNVLEIAVDEEDIKVPKYPYDQEKLQLIIGLRHDKLTLKKVREPKWIIIDEKGLYQNLLITGTIGTGKTAAAMYPMTKQIMFYKCYEPSLKPGMLILDVKGNYYKQVLEFAKESGRVDDIVIIELSGEYKYNPMHKPHMKPLVLANRIKVVLSLFSGKNSNDSYWLDKAELLIAECIKLCRLYNDGYVSFAEINKLVNNRTYLVNKITILVEDQDIMTNEEAELFETCRDYFENEYTNLSENTLSIIQSVVTQMTQFFYTDPDVRNSFCAPLEELNFLGFKEVVDNGKIVILKMNIAQYRNLAKTIAAYMKLDFQDEVMQRLVREDANTTRPLFMISDEYQEFVTATDAEFYAQSREPKCCTIVATQSYTSLINTLKDRDTVRTVTQNLINKIWLRTDDLFTVEEAQKQLGKEDKEKITKSISESSGDVTKSRILGTLVSDKSSISESVNVNTVKEFTFEETLFTQQLDVFTGIAFLSDGAKIIEPSVVHLQPYFSEMVTKGINNVAATNNNKKNNNNNKTFI